MINSSIHNNSSIFAAGQTDENGVFQDNKNLNLSTKTLTFENLANTKSSNSQGFGIGAGVNPQGDISSTSMQLSTGTSYERTKTLATLGNGNINITDKTNSDDLERLNTDTTKVDKSLFKTDTGTSASGTLDTRLLTAEGRAQIADDAKKAKEHAQDIANGVITVATNEEIDITNLVDTVRDNTSATKLKDYLTQTKDGQQIFAGLQADPQSEEYHNAQIAANQKLQEFRGLEVEKVVYYDAKDTTNEKLKDIIAYDAQNDTLTQRDTQGATITQGDSTGTILLDASGNAQNLSSKQNDTVASGHEVGEEKYLQNGYGTFFTDSYDTKEAMNDTYGAYYAQRLNEATNGAISDVPYATKTNTPFIIAGTNSANGMIISDNGVEYKTMVYIWKGVGYGESAFGHVSASVNDTSYSFGPNGMDIRPLDQYINKQAAFRSGLAVEIPLSPVEEKKFESFLKSYDSPYWINYCPSPVNQGLHELGYKFDSQIIPMSLYMELMRNNISKNPTAIEKMK